MSEATGTGFCLAQRRCRAGGGGGGKAGGKGRLALHQQRFKIPLLSDVGSQGRVLGWAVTGCDLHIRGNG